MKQKKIRNLNTLGLDIVLWITFLFLSQSIVIGVLFYQGHLISLLTEEVLIGYITLSILILIFFLYILAEKQEKLKLIKKIGNGTYSSKNIKLINPDVYLFGSKRFNISFQAIINNQKKTTGPLKITILGTSEVNYSDELKGVVLSSYELKKLNSESIYLNFSKLSKIDMSSHGNYFIVMALEEWVHNSWYLVDYVNIKEKDSYFEIRISNRQSSLATIFNNIDLNINSSSYSSGDGSNQYGSCYETRYGNCYEGRYGDCYEKRYGDCYEGRYGNCY